MADGRASARWSANAVGVGFAAIFVLFAAAISAVTFFSARALDRQMIEDELVGMIGMYLDQNLPRLDEALAGRIRALDALSRSPLVLAALDGADPLELSVLVRTWQRMDPSLAGVVLVREGQALTALSSEAVALGPVGVEEARAALLGQGVGERWVSGVIVDGERRVVVVGQVVGDARGALGLLVGEIDVADLLMDIFGCRYWRTALVSTSGQVLWASEGTGHAQRGSAAWHEVAPRALTEERTAVGTRLSRRISAPYAEGMVLLVEPTESTVVRLGERHTAYVSMMSVGVFFAALALALALSFVPVRLSRRLLETKRMLEEELAVVDEFVYCSTTDLSGVIIGVTSAFCALSGYSRGELLGHTHAVVRNPKTPDAVFKELWTTVSRGEEWRATVRNLAKDGTDFWTETVIRPVLGADGEPVAYTAYRRDITYQKRVEELSVRDELTGLFNRRHFNHVFPKELARARREGNTVGFLILDIDYFKPFNDTYGHHAGDGALRLVGRVLADHARRASDYAFRLGGEEFGVVFTGLTQAQAVAYAEVLRGAVQDLSVAHRGSAAAPVVTVSMGLVLVSPGEPMMWEELYQRADSALYQAKERGRNRVVLAESTSV
ncbi:MAG: diguanylate cyclase [Deltaproteobacteria bacterium]|nr:diguanylate cyclase [Deltaproteobacteria bacterium]